ncbi:hypothetical protein LH128_02624 [Sphingomonas sp. LH128]|nr:hypothetical protein LH128_02624 [Sphingomonas sp. LH128]
MVFRLLNRAASNAAVNLLAKRASSPEAFGDGIGTAFGRETVEAYFRKFGMTVKKFEYHADKDLFIGYVNTPYRKETFASMIVMGEKEGSVAASYPPEVHWGEDFFGLTARKEFLDRIVGAVGSR